MKVGDMVRFRILKSNQALIDEFGHGLVEAVYRKEGTVTVIWPKKNWMSRTLSHAYLEVTNEGI
jgi:hypothetical protein